VNPALVPGGGGERAIAARLASEFRLAGLDVELTEIAPGWPNVVARLTAVHRPGLPSLFVE